MGWFKAVIERRRSWVLTLVTMLALVVAWQVAAFAVHDTGAFELDGNAVNGAAAGDDWDNVCEEAAPATNCGTTDKTSGATAVSWTAELDRNATIFTGGGSKDPEDISAWAWKDGAGGLPDKDNLLHSFAARYDTAEGDDVLFFGSDRFDNSGDAHQAFWFLQDEVTLGTTKSGGGFNFNGEHTNGDLLVITNFSNGGTTSTIFVYKWNDQVNGNLELLASSDDANCNTAEDDDPFCGIVNANTINMPWTFTDKSGTANNGALNGEFYEGGVNLSTLGLDNECFSSVVSETRSSTSTTATLKDFVLGQFDTCKAEMTTQASTGGPVTPGTSVTDEATIAVTGADKPADPTSPPPVTFFLCGPSTTANPDCSSGGTNVGTGTLNGGTVTDDGIAKATSPAVNTATSKLAPGKYCFRAEWTGDTNYPDDLSHTNTTTECFEVQDTSTTTTAQKWLPQDTAEVTLASGNTATGTVTFELFESADCSGAAVQTFANRPVTDDPNGPDAETNNTSYYTTVKTISWKATFNPTGGATGSIGPCETMSVNTLDNDITAP